jgi:ElaA protein
VGRVAVDNELQGQGLGTVLMEGVQRHLGTRQAALNAQAHLERWYQRLGWTRVGEIFEEAEIPHVKMVWGKDRYCG